MFEPIVLVGCSRHQLEGVDNIAINEAVLKRRDIKLDDSPGNTFNEDSFYPVNDPACKELIEKVDQVIKSEVNKYFRTDNTWSHILDPKESTMYHSHTNDRSLPGISWVYYTQTLPDAGNLVLHMQAGSKYILKEIQPKEGMLVIFPDFVFHFTKKNNSGTTRISISGNARPADEDAQKVPKEPGTLFNYLGIFNN